MKSIRSTLIASALIAGLASAALAQNTPTDSPHAGRVEKMHAQKTERHNQHLTALKTKLNLQATQEASWTQFTQSMQHPEHMARPDRSTFEKMTTPERLDQMQAMKAGHDAQMQKRAEATKVFYASLSAEQKQVFDKETSHAMKDDMHAMKHGGGESGHHGKH